MSVKSTTKYEMFKKINTNRDISDSLVKLIMKSISECDLTPYCPIQVDDKMGIIDGQHRLEACRRLQIPVWYEQTEIHRDQLHLLQSKRDWTAADYLHYWIEQGKEEYINFQKLITKFNLNIHHGLRIMRIKYLPTSRQGMHQHGVFIQGTMVLPAEEHLMERLQNVNEIIQLLDQRLPPGPEKMFIRQIRFHQALGAFLEYEEVDIDMFKSKLIKNLDKVTNRFRIAEYVKLFQSIYNFHNRNPIKVPFDDEKIA